MFASQEGCIFCDSYKKDNKKVIWENKEVFSVLNYKPSIPGHALIITKQHLTDLKEITGSILENFIHAVPQTFEVIQTIYEQKPETFKEFYKELIKNPPEIKSSQFAEQMLKHPHLLVKPIAYNWGMNYGYEAGQRAIHLHIHLFPRREMGLGIATAMRKHLAEKIVK
ncbi:MAG: HIT family protein [Candidatus Thorarchaeota archaeon]